MSEIERSAQELVRSARLAAPAWREMTAQRRLSYVKGLRKIIIRNLDLTIKTIREETGRPELDILGGDLWVLLDQIRYYEKNAVRFLETERISSGSIFYFGSRSYVEYQPYGVTLVLSPWNYPLQLSLVPVVSALAAGNAVILKPSEAVPLTNALIAAWFAEAGFPTDVVQVAQGDSTLGSQLVEAKPDKIFLTGSTQTGIAVAKAASQYMIPVDLELGGKDAMIILDDAFFSRAVHAALYGAFSNAGQVCVATKRILVHRTLYDRFVRALNEAVARLRVGTEADADLGPLLRSREAEQTRNQVKDSIARGAQAISPLQGDGTRVYPVILTGVTPECELETQETFGPVVWVEPFDQDAQAIERANASPWGLSGSVWSQDIARARRVARELVTGSVAINDVILNIAQPGVPFGGEKNSGHGRSHGKEGLRAFCRQKSVFVRKTRISRQFNWFPFNPKIIPWLKRLMRIRFGFFCIAAALLSLAMTVHPEGSVKGHLFVQVKQIPSTQGHLAYALFAASDGFPSQSEKALLRRYAEIPKSLELTLDIPDLPYGSYALSVYHDQNDNQKLDKNFLGIPKESIGFSMNPKVRRGSPSFQETRFEVGAPQVKIEVQMIH
jgi:4,4'-diapolycopenoate synthase